MSTESRVLGVLDSYSHTESLIEELHHVGIPLHRISALLSDKQATADFAHDHMIGYPEGALEGAASGGVLGGALGLLAGISLSAIPSLGPFIGAGPLVAALGGIAFGGLTGALVGFGIPEIHAKIYEDELHAGRLLLVVQVDDSGQAARVVELLAKAGARHVQTLPGADGPQ